MHTLRPEYRLMEDEIAGQQNPTCSTAAARLAEYGLGSDGLGNDGATQALSGPAP